MKKKLPHPYSYEGMQLIAKISLKAFQKRIKWSTKNPYADFPKAGA